jgi:hypothetical protein
MSTFDDDLEKYFIESIVAPREMQMLKTMPDNELPLVISQIESDEAKQELERRLKL